MTILVLDGTDVPNPEDLAMLQALYSRSPAPVMEHLQRVREVGSGKFMGQYYVGYNHKSIGDCGNTAIFFEGVSMLAAKAIQDWPLYSGQECSTRYIDFSSQPFLNPMGTNAGELIQEAWRALYVRSLPRIEACVREEFPPEGEPTKRWEKTVKARAFDIARSLLPAGATTSLSWSTNLRQAHDLLRWLGAHPLPEMGGLALSTWSALKARYPNSFDTWSGGSGQSGADYRREAMKTYYNDDYPGIPLGDHRIARVGGVHLTTNISSTQLKRYERLIEARPRGQVLPRWMDELGTITSAFLLDFGSFRDLQRHRHGMVRMPKLTPGTFNPWYLKQMPDFVMEDVQRTVRELALRINELDTRSEIRQYYCPMGTLVPCRITQTLPAWVYRVELRSSKTVHPTLREVIHDEVACFRKFFPNFPLHVDTSPDHWTERRGDQTIEERA